jgi:hypothetical protein
MKQSTQIMNVTEIKAKHKDPDPKPPVIIRSPFFDEAPVITAN